MGRTDLETAKLPLAFIGLAAYRAWIELAFVGSYFEGRGRLPATRDVFDFVDDGCSSGGRGVRQASLRLIEKPWARIMSLCLLLFSTLCVLLGAAFPSCPSVLCAAGAIAGGAGIAIILILWSELYGCLNPLRVAPLLFRIHRCCGAHRVHDEGFMFPWFAVYLFVLPVVTIVSVGAAFRSTPLSSERACQSRVAFPLEACAVDGDILVRVRACAAAWLHHFGVRAAFLARHVVCGPVRVLSVAMRKGKFDFSVIYRVASR